MASETLLPLYDQQLRIERRIPGVRREATNQVVRYLRPAPGMNFISYTFFDAVTVADYEGLIVEESAYFQPRQQPFSWDLCEHDGAEAFVARLVANGFVLEDLDDLETVMVLAPAETSQPWLGGDGGTTYAVLIAARSWRTSWPFWSRCGAAISVGSTSAWATRWRCPIT